MKAQLLLVHSGTQFPDYLNDCIQLALQQDIHICLILSRDLHNFVQHNIQLEVLEDYCDSRYLNYSNKTFDINFRDGFWNRTSTRFFILNNYARQKSLNSFFHIENDVALFSNLQHIKQILENSDKEMFLIMDSYRRCIPSFIWFRDYQILENLSNHIYLNQDKNDMESLALFFHHNRNTVGNLPIIPSLSSISLKDSAIDYSNLFPQLQCIFDGAAIGQYLFGIDCINDAGKNTKGFINETCTFDADYFHYKISNGLFYLKYQEHNIPIINLHIHCKNLKQLL